MPRHFRIRTFPESADDGATLVAYLEGHNVWDCYCGFENKDREFCGQCSARRGTWQCEPCGHVNPTDTKRCQDCGRPRERE